MRNWRFYKHIYCSILDSRCSTRLPSSKRWTHNSTAHERHNCTDSLLQKYLVLQSETVLLNVNKFNRHIFYKLGIVAPSKIVNQIKNNKKTDIFESSFGIGCLSVWNYGLVGKSGTFAGRNIGTAEVLKSSAVDIHRWLSGMGKKPRKWG